VTRQYNDPGPPGSRAERGDDPKGKRGLGAALGKHLGDWPLFAVVAAFVVPAAVLAIPREVEPTLFPRPLIDHPSLEAEWSADHQRAQGAHRAPLPVATREVGEMLRRYGANLASEGHDPGLYQGITSAVGRALRAHGAEPLLALRAVQTELFLDALRESESRGQSTEALLELGGDFEKRARANGWWTQRLLLSEEERRVLFQVRWSSLTGLLKSYPFAPSLDAWRTYYAVLLANPENSAGRGDAELSSQRLSYVQALGQRDASYPKLFAEGVLQFQAGHPEDASRAFASYLADPNNKRWRLLARNHLLACASGQESL
jgi:hypothetical protein